MNASAEPRATLHEVVDRRLRESGHRYTPARARIAEAIDAMPGPSTASQVADHLRQPLSSVYRNLRILVSVGVLARLVGPDRQERFELVRPGQTPHHHHHLICSICGVMEEYPVSDDLERLIDELVSRLTTDFQVVDHSLDLVGTCVDCDRRNPGSARQ